MQTTHTTTRRGFLAGAVGLVVLSAAGCQASSAATSASPSPTSSRTASPTSSAASPDLATLRSQVPSTFKQASYTDTQTGKALPYNVYLPAGYDVAKKYPLVLYIADSSLVGQDVTAPLSQYGALIWASSTEQARHQSIVVVPEYPGVILDDHSGYTTTDYIEMTARLVQSMSSTYSVDANRIYGTGQSMGCMTVMLLAAEHPELFTAELLVSGQWDPSQLTNLAEEKFTYIAAGGDGRASGGQTDVQNMLKSAGVAYQTAQFDATWSASQLAAAAAKLYAAGDTANFATFKTGTVLTASDSSSSGGMTSSEHMASFEPAYKISALRDWLFAQTP